MWTMFRALAARIGWSQEQIEAVERGGKATVLPVPINSAIMIKVRPDPDWGQRIVEALNGTLVNSRQERAGTIPIPHGQLMVADPEVHLGSLPKRFINSDSSTAHVTAGEYDVFLTVAHSGSEETDDYEERISHAFALLRGNTGVATIELLTNEAGVELGAEGPTLAFAGAGVISQIAAEYPDLRSWTVHRLLQVVLGEEGTPDTRSARIPTKDGTGALIAFYAGDWHDFPLYRLADAEGATIGVLVELYVDNRPWEI
jgi:hypothetical protein